jgi:hypothetical protein
MMMFVLKTVKKPSHSTRDEKRLYIVQDPRTHKGLHGLDYPKILHCIWNISDSIWDSNDYPEYGLSHLFPALPEKW